MSAAARRTLLLEAARRVIDRDGVAGVTTRAVCAEAGMGQGAFHHLFASRDELLHQVLSELIEGIVARSTDVDPATPFEQVLVAALLLDWETLRDTPRIRTVLYEITVAGLRGAVQPDLVRFQYRRYREVTEQALARLAERAGVRWTAPVPAVARTVIAALDGIALQYLVDGDADAAGVTLRSFARDLAGRAVPVDARPAEPAAGSGTMEG
ncbi:TetR/AcrR family transcriptional regulator [Nakamurella endophytica]|nr:TetR family transcriptional regulator [Nakamurella endophytica]